MSQGEWIAENPYVTDPPIDAYGMKWTIAPGGMAFEGKLYTIYEGKETKILWTFLSYWDPTQSKVVSVQYGDNPGLGNIAVGVNPPATDVYKDENETSIFDSMGALIGKAGHRNELKGNKLFSNSFNIINGEWVTRGEFVWTLKKENG